MFCLCLGVFLFIRYSIGKMNYRQQRIRQNYIRNVNNVLLLTLLLSLQKKYKRKPQKPRRFWVRTIYQNREGQGAYHNLLNEMRLTDQEKYFNYLRMSSGMFQKLLNLVGPKLTKLYCVREPISPGERLAMTLRYLASGDSMVSISFAFRIAHNTVSKIIRETCDAIWECLNKSVLLEPNQEAWLNIATDFNRKWQIPHCVGAIDGKHVVIQALPKSGSTYYNYKGTHSIVLLALCDANYKFTLVDIGSEGRHSDGGIFKNSPIGKSLISGSLNLPAPCELGDLLVPINYYICADEAFPLTTCIMRPYAGHFLSQPKRVFNYRLCRARRIIENAFGILASRWRIFRRPIIASESTVIAIVKSTVCLHNFLMNSGQDHYFTPALVDRENKEGEVIEGEWRNEHFTNLLPIGRTSTNMYGRNAEQMREYLSNYFMNEGSVTFQWNK